VWDSLKSMMSKFGGAARGFKMFTPIIAAGTVLIYAASGHFAKGSTFFSVLAVGLAAIGAALFAGLLFGFLFGLPKSLEPQTHPDPKRLLATNTNLDQISDWLTKILVGIGLVQLGKLAHGVSKLGDALGPGLGGGLGAKPFAVALLLYSVVDGFLVGYIWTRIDLSERFKKAAEDLGRIVAADQLIQETLNVKRPEQLAQPPA
jgi:hypothetical protein